MYDRGLSFDVLCSDAINALKENQDEHVKELADAWVVWRRDVAEELAEVTKIIDISEEDLSQLNNLRHNPPIDNTKQYTKYIGVFEAAVRAGQRSVKMDADEYDQLFNDNWNWRVSSKSSNSAYSTRM